MMMTLKGMPAVAVAGAVTPNLATLTVWQAPMSGGVVSGWPHSSAVTLSASPPPAPRAGLPGSSDMVAMVPP